MDIHIFLWFFFQTFGWEWEEPAEVHKILRGGSWTYVGWILWGKELEWTQEVDGGQFGETRLAFIFLFRGRWIHGLFLGATFSLVAIGFRRAYSSVFYMLLKDVWKVNIGWWWLIFLSNKAVCFLAECFGSVVLYLVYICICIKTKLQKLTLKHINLEFYFLLLW